MKKLKWLAAVAFVMLFTYCTESKKDPVAVSEENKPEAQEPKAAAAAATFTINNQKYTCDDVGAIGYKKENSITINARSGAEGQTVFFSFTLKDIGKGQKKFSAAGNSVEFTTSETYSNTFKEDCTGKDSFTDGTVTITKLIDYTPEKDGWVEGNFEGQLSIKREVPPYPCGNGKSTNSKTELVNVKGSFTGAYINTKELPL